MRQLGLAGVVLALLSSPAAAIELSLEENRAERGSVGYVDMQRLFAGSPDAARAKESFSDLVRQAEERVNAKKAEAIKLRQELSSVRADRASLAASTPAVASPAPIPAAKAAPAVSTQTLSLPGMAPTDAAVTDPAPPEPAPAKPSGPSLGQRLAELDARAALLQAEIDRKEAALKKERDDADRGLIDVENRKTDQVLARLYRAVSETARKEGVSVVVDKSAILFGHPAVDLTDKVLAHLRGAAGRQEP